MKRFLPLFPRCLLAVLTGSAALGAAMTARGSDSTALFNEVMYNDAVGEGEWIELANLMGTDIDLSGWKITGGIGFTFPEGTVLAAGAYEVISNGLATVPGAPGPWEGRLSNGGELIQLVNVAGRIMDELDYRDGGRWPLGADGSGATLSRRRRSADSGPQAWAASSGIGGTPGAANFPAVATTTTAVRISEISGALDPVFRVELVNEGPAAVSLHDFKLGSYVLPELTLNAGEFLVIDETALGFHPIDGDRLFLHGAGGAALVDAVIVRPTGRARREGRMMVPASPSFGNANPFTLSTDVVINEILFHAPPFPSSPALPEVVETSGLVTLDAVWRYLSGGGQAGPGWAAVNHPVGNGWLQGQGLLGFETTPGSLPEPLRTPFASSNAVSYYFETDFTLTEAERASLTVLRLEHVIDDGAVFFLNGVELPGTRFNLPAGTIAVTTPTTAGVGNAVLQTPVDVPVAGLPLVAGVNRLSVQVHQQIATSNDMICGVRLSALRKIAPAVPGQPVRSNPEEWIELHNKGNAAVDLSGWQLDDAVSFTFPAGTQLAAGDYLVVANDAAPLTTAWPERATKIIGGLTGKLDNDGERLELLDAIGNPADEVVYVPGKWSRSGGSTLELRDARADNSLPGAWADSDETAVSAWQTFTWRNNGQQRFGPAIWNEFRLGMLDAGECLIDDLSVKRNPDGAPQELIRNGNFETLPTGSNWRFLGNHGTSAVIPEPGAPSNHVLHLAASGPTETNHNHAESTFVNNQALNAADIHEISFRARWLSGTNQLNTRAYYQKLAKTWELPLPARRGTPGAVNSRATPNAGPVVHSVTHEPAVPTAGQPVTVSAEATDPDGIATAVVHSRLDGASTFTATPMTLNTGRWSAVLPSRAAGAILQFYVEFSDPAGASTQGPAAGAAGGALIQWQDDQISNLPAPKLRLIMRAADHAALLAVPNLLSNQPLPGTLVSRNEEIYYGVGVTLKGSAAARARDGNDYIGYDIGFPADRKFHGVHESIGIDRSGRNPAVRSQDEIYVRHTFHRAGLPCPQDDLCYFIAPGRIHTGPAILQMAAYGGSWAESQYAEEGTVFNLDITYDPTSLSQPGNPESLKLPSPFVHVGTDLADRGPDKEQYRGPFDIRSRKRRDQFDGLIRLAQTMALPSTTLAAAAPDLLDLDEVFRCTALVNLWGVGDSYYTGGLQHNVRFFVPDSGRGIQFLPWDMDFAMSASATSALQPSGNALAKLITSSPGHQRRYLGHVRHLCDTVFKTSELTPWLTHYGSIVGKNFSGAASYITARRNFALGQMPSQTSFVLTTNNGAPFATEAAEVLLQGTAGIDVRDIRRDGIPSAVVWSSLTQWQLTVPLLPGPNVISFESIGYSGNPLASDSITVTRTLPEGVGYDAWRELHFNATELGDPAISGPAADPGRTGLVNLLRYAFGLAPKATPPATLFQVTSSPGMLHFEFPRLKQAPDLTYLPEMSTTGSHWTPVTGTLMVVRDNGDGTETIRATTPMDIPAKLLRIRILTN
jgi:hypothetical protein